MGKIRGLEVLSKNRFRVAIFGSARITKDDKYYKMIHSLAEKIGNRGIDLVTGGGPGIMEAASAGHEKGRKNNGSHAVGLLIKLPTEQKSNDHIRVGKEFLRFSERLDTFMTLSSAVVVAPGGLGTLLEFFYTWQLVQVKQICDIPIILIGDHYRDLIKWIKKNPLKNKYLNKEDLNPIYMTRNITETMDVLNKAYKHYKKDGKNFCLNINKYKIS